MMECEKCALVSAKAGRKAGHPGCSGARGFRVTRASRALGLAPRQNELPCRVGTKLANELKDDV